MNRRFKISVKVTYSDGSYVWKSAAEFNPDIVDWQYSAVAINLSDNTSAIKTPVSLSIHPRYDSQANEVIFDNLSVTKDNITNYSYDNDGNLTSRLDNASQVTSMGYNSDNDLTSVTDAKKKTSTYTYTNHNMTNSTSQNGVTTDYTYDTSGNPTKMVIQNMSSSMKIQTDTIYTPDGAYVSETADEDNNKTTYS